MAHYLHIHIITSSRRVVTGLQVLLMASGLVERVSVQDPTDARLSRDQSTPDLTIMDTMLLAQCGPSPNSLLKFLPTASLWCALVHTQRQQQQAVELGATYILPPGFAAESLFSILARCLPDSRPLPFDAVALT